ncbi:MAG: flagellar hook-associated protein FlgK [Pseudomonadota bacterium]
MASGILGVALSGLNAAQLGIRTTEHNIANVNTTGYRRQEATFAATKPAYSNAGWVGTGTALASVQQIYSRFLDNEVLRNQAQLSRHETYGAQATQIDKLLGDEDSGLATALDSYFAAVHEVANDPTSNAARQNLLSAGNNLAGRFNTLDDKLKSMRANTNADISAIARQVNVLSGQIANLNVTISRDEALNGRSANDLRDQRQQLVSDLNKLVNVSSIEQSDGTLSLFVGSGQPLVVGAEVYTMSSVSDPGDSTLKLPALTLGSSTITLDSSLISGGQLGGILAMREEVLLPALDDLNRIATVVATSVNTVHRAGLDYNLNAGLDFFTNPVVAQGATVGVLNMTVTNDLLLDRVGYNISLTAGGYDVTVLSTGTTTTYASLAALNAAGLGFTLAAGTPAPSTGESWVIGDYAGQMAMELTATSQVAAAGSTATGPGDNSNMLTLADLRNGDLLNNGTVNFSEAYQETVASTASKASEADLNTQAFSTLVEQATASQQEVSGVNLDEEAVNLIRFQQAYQAAARAMQIASSLFDEVLNAVR